MSMEQPLLVRRSMQKHSSPQKEQGKLSSTENDISSILETDKVAFSGVEKKTFHGAENDVSNLASIRRPGEGDL